MAASKVVTGPTDQPESRPPSLTPRPPTTLPPNKRDNTTPSCAVCQRRKVGLVANHAFAPSVDGNGASAKDDDEMFQTARAPAPTSSTGMRHDETSSLVLESTRARLVRCSGGYRYVNNHLWHSLPAHESHTQGPGTALPTATSTPSVHHSPTDGSQTHRSVESGFDSIASHNSESPSIHFVFGQKQSMSKIVPLAPGHIVQLWHVYLERVDPMMKAFHSPSVQQMVLGQIGKAEILSHEYALASAIHLISVVSLTDSECQLTLQERRHDAIDHFRRATETALSMADFVTTTDLTVLQALVLYLAALRSLGESATVWSLLGITIRVAGTQGLARDGSFLSLSPFEAELRRRLWWAIVYMDARTAELVGQDGDLLVQKHDVKPPSNLNDSDLFPSMRRMPDSKYTLTEMLYVQFRATLATILRTLPGGFGAGATFKRLENPSIPLTEKLDAISMLEQRLNDEILSGCDPGVPLQLFTLNAVQTLLNKMRLIAHIPLTYIGNAWTANGRYSEDVFHFSVTLIRLQLDLWNESCLQRWHWHWRGQFQWFALACLIRQGRLRPPGEQTTEAWATIRKVFDTILPSLDLSARKSPLVVGIQSLLKAGAKTESIEAARQIQHPNAVPDSISHTSPSYRSEASLTDSSFDPAKIATPRDENEKIASRSQLKPCNLEINGGRKDAELEFDFDTVDWMEFDRLTAELCQQGG
nr:bikaverin cluster transcription factor bik5 [Quercus suber]